jgi:glycosyltransferase involved in cell wall biosynthesis
MALPVAEGLGVPLYAQVLDPPEFWFIVDRVPALSRRLLAARFDATLRSSAACAAISDAMRDRYEQSHGVRSVSVLPALDASLCVEPSRRPRADRELVIGVAGNLHQVPAWNTLLAALDAVDWKIAARDIRLRVLGRSAPVYTSNRVNIEFLGWRAQADTIRLLAETDLLYCPSWFGPEHAAEASLCFPSKLPAYFAAGRPVLFHGPSYAAAVPFLCDYNAAVCCHSLEVKELIAALEKVASDRELSATLAANGRHAFEQRLTLAHLRSSFGEFLGEAEDVFLPRGDRRAEVGTAH